MPRRAAAGRGLHILQEIRGHILERAEASGELTEERLVATATPFIPRVHPGRRAVGDATFNVLRS